MPLSSGDKKELLIIACVGYVLLLHVFVINAEGGPLFLVTIFGFVSILVFLWWIVKRSLTWQRVDHWSVYGFPPAIRIFYHIIIATFFTQVAGFSIYLGEEGSPNLRDSPNYGTLAVIFGVIGIGIGILWERLSR